MANKKIYGFKDAPEDKPINLPTTPDAFDKLIDVLMDRYKLPDRDHASAVVAQRIMHLPVDQATSTLRYLGHSVLKHIAYQVAQGIGSEIAHKVQIKDIEAELTVNPNNQQAVDALTKAAQDGSKLALATMEKLGLTLPAKPAADSAPPESTGEAVQH